MRQIVGIDRKIKRAWLDAILDRLTQTTNEAELRTFLDAYLKDELPGKESRAKSAGIILRVWSGIPATRIALRDRAVAMLPRISGQERIWLHWGMTALAYPFFRDTAEVVGRLLALQDDFTTGHVQGRMLTTWGDTANEKQGAIPKIPVTTKAVDDHQDSEDERRVGKSIKSEVLRTSPERVDRSLRVQGTAPAPECPFAALSAECAEHFRNGHYFGCIALTQTLLEAVICHVWQIKFKKKPNQEGSFGKNLEALHKKTFIGDMWKARLDQMWADRHSFHHLRPSVESDRQKLEETASSMLKLLNDLEREVFGFSVREGKMVPDHPEYWSIHQSRK